MILNNELLPGELQEELHRHRQLWAAVVDRLIIDAARPDRDGARARAWLRRPDVRACDWAGINPDTARTRFRQMADKAERAISQTMPNGVAPQRGAV